MNRNSGIQIRYPGFYRQDKLQEARVTADLTLEEVSRRSGVTLDSTRRVFLGTAHQKQVWPIAQLLKVDWSELHDLDPPRQSKIDRPVLNGDSRSARSMRAGHVGVRRPAP
jgi:hypothetical protein